MFSPIWARYCEVVIGNRRFMADAQSYYDDLLTQGYTPEGALQYTKQYFPDFELVSESMGEGVQPMVESIPQAAESVPLVESVQDMQSNLEVGGDSNDVFSTGGVDESSKQKLIVVAVGIILFVAILGVSLFFVFGSDDDKSSSTPAFVGKWTMDRWGDTEMLEEGVWAEFKEDGVVCNNFDGCDGLWKEDGGVLNISGVDGSSEEWSWEIDGENLVLNDNDGTVTSWIPVVGGAPFESGLGGTWRVCWQDAPATECGDSEDLQNISMNYLGEFTGPWSDAGWNEGVTNDSSIHWYYSANDITYTYHGKYEIKNDVLFLAFYSMHNSDTDVSIENRLMAYVGVKNVDIENNVTFNGVVDDVLPYPGWWVEYIDSDVLADEQSD